MRKDNFNTLALLFRKYNSLELAVFFDEDLKPILFDIYQDEFKTYPLNAMMLIDALTELFKIDLLRRIR